jgi:polyisoprenyl-phosphate glycosyltransferase
MIDLGIVVPCYNEMAVLPESAKRLTHALEGLIASGRVRPTSAIWFIDDGSQDGTWALIEKLVRENSAIHGIKLSRNRGHQNALLAGLLNVSADAVISVDADLQDDLAAMETMVDEHAKGADIVYGVRRTRDCDTLGKRITALSYYRLLQWMGVNIVFNHADYRLMSRRAIDALREFREANLFLRGIVPQLGFRTAEIYYDRAERFAGESKYPLGKMLGLAIEGITSFSSAPLRWITALGLFISLATFGVGLWALWATLSNGSVLPGWASTVVPIYFLGGVQLLCIGIIGEYLAKIYMETKARPRFVVEQKI